MNEFVKEQKEFNNSVVDFMKEQKEFNNSVVDFMKEQKEFNQKVDQRLSILEKDMKEIKSLPTIKHELKNK